MCDVRRSLLICAVVLIAGATDAEEVFSPAENELLISSLFADSSIVAPVVDWRRQGVNGSSVRYGLSGWTVGGEVATKMAGARSFLVSADATPIHAHNSDRIFVDGRREHSLEYRNGSYRVRSGLRFTRASQVTDVQAAVLYETVADGTTAGGTSSLQERWRRPYVGLDVTHAYTNKRGGDPLISSMDGIEVTARGEFFAGSRSWGRVSVTENGGRDLSRWHFTHAASVMSGSSLDVVNRQLLGGSWDALGGTALYGFRYGEFRVRRAVTGSGGVDYKLPGNLRAGVRLSCTDNDVARTCGGALNVTMTWRTFGFNGGIGMPAHRSGAEAPRVAYLGAVIPLWQR
jgi:hypothetical protein